MSYSNVYTHVRVIGWANNSTMMCPSLHLAVLAPWTAVIFFYIHMHTVLLMWTYIWTFSTILRLLTEAEYILPIALRLASEVRGLTQRLRFRQSVRRSNNTVVYTAARLFSNSAAHRSRS